MTAITLDYHPNSVHILPVVSIHYARCDCGCGKSAWAIEIGWLWWGVGMGMSH